MHGSRVYKPFGMRNGCRINNNLYTGCTAAVYINFFCMGNGCREISRFVSDQFRQPCIIPLPKTSMYIRTAKDFQPKITSAFDNQLAYA